MYLNLHIVAYEISDLSDTINFTQTSAIEFLTTGLDNEIVHQVRPVLSP